MATFDTLGLAEDSERAGLPAATARGVAAAIRDRFTGADALATKADLEKLEIRIDGKMASLEPRLIMWFVGALIAQAALILGILDAMFRAYGLQ